MDGDSYRLVIVFILILFSAFFSSAETAFISVNKIRMQTLANNENKKAKIVLKICDNTDKMLSAILIGNNIVNLSASAITTTWATDVLGSKFLGVATGVLTLLVLMLGEIMPKTLATIYSEKITLIYCYPIYYFMIILTPIIFIVNKLSTFVMKLFRIDINKQDNSITEEELKTIVDTSLEDGVLENEEHKIINNVFDFDNNVAKDVMIPKINIVSISKNETYDNILKIFKEERYTRIPVYDENPDDIIGMINIKDLLLEDKDTFTVSKILRQPIFSYEFNKVHKIFKEMKEQRNNMAIILDEYGMVAGLITLEDIVEEIVGEIQDEYDTEEELNIVQLSEKEYLINGCLNINDVNEQLNLNLESKNFDSLGGIVIENLEEIPKEGDTVTLEDCCLTIKTMESNRIEKIQLVLL